MMRLDPNRRGKPIDLVLLQRYRAATGQAKRSLLNQLVYENEPLVTVLVDQLCGRGGQSKRGAVKLWGCDGFTDLDWSDAKQAGLMAFMKAMDSYDPAKGKLPYHLLLKVRYELQCLVQREGLSRAPRGEQGLAVDLVGEQTELDELSRGHHEDGLLTSEGFGEADIQRWQETGAWPETIEAARAEIEAHRIRREAETWDPLVAFLDTQLVFRSFHRIPRAFVFEHLDTFLHATRAYVPRRTLVAALDARQVRPVHVWHAGRAVRGFAGVDLRAV